MIGKVIRGKYRVMDEVGRGSVATVYLARDVAENRVVALKVIHLDLVSEGQFLRRFQREAKLLAKLNCPQAVKLLDYGKDAELSFMVLEYVPGKTVVAILEEEGVLEIKRALDIARQVAQCLAAADQVGIVHRDIRPANIMVTHEGRVKVMDFGIARGVDLSRLTATGTLGSPHYLSPELAEGKKADIRSDIYSLGVVLFEMLIGERPYDADNAVDIVLKHLEEPVPSLQEIDKEIPAEVDELVAKCLAKDPADRFQTPVDLTESIDEALGKAEGLPAPGMEDALSGQTLGQYQLMGRLGRGGMATVYKAYQPSLDRHVAVKVLPTFLADDPDFAARFQREARAIAKLNHPNILPVHDYGQEGELTYIVMRYVPGGALKERLGQPLDLDTAVEFIAQVGRALEYAHQRDILHRDVKPANILVAEGKWALLSDFGLAKMVGSSLQITKAGTGMGTPAYMSPEQAQGTGVDARSDIYSLGIVLFEMLTGRVPFEADTPLAVLVKHLTAVLPLPREINPDIPEPVERVILKAVAKPPEERYQRVKEMVEALERAVEEVRAEEGRPPQEKLAALYAEAVGFLKAKEWQKALDKWAEVQAIQPGYRDFQEVAATARSEIERLTEEKRRQEKLAALYTGAVGFLKAKEWQKALDNWAEVQAIDPRYPDPQQVAATAKREVDRLTEEKRRQEKLAALYAGAVKSLKAKKWQKALDNWAEVQAIDPRYPDPQKVAATAQREVERLEKEKRRQEKLAALYAEAVGFLKAKEWQKALDKWAQVQAIEPEYPDRKKVVAKAKKELAKWEEIALPGVVMVDVDEEESPLWQRVPVWAWGAAGVILLAIVIVGGVLVVAGGEKKPIAVVVQTTTPTVTVAPGPVSLTASSEPTAVTSPTSTPVPAMPTPTVAIAATQTALADAVKATVLAEATATAEAAATATAGAFTPTPTATQTPEPPTATATSMPRTEPTPTPTPVTQLADSIALTIYLRDTLAETGVTALSGDQVNAGMIYDEGKFFYGDAAVQIGEMIYHFDKPEVAPGEPEQLPDPWRVEFEFAEELVARTGNQAGFDPKKAQFWVGTLGSDSAVGEDNPYSLTMKLYEGNELRKSIQVFLTVADAPERGGDGGEGGEEGGGGGWKPP